VNGWPLDTNVVAELAKQHGTARVLRWAAAQDEALLFLSILTPGEYAKGLHNVPPDSPLRPRIAASIAALEARFADRILQPTDPIVRRWGAISGDVKRQTGQTPPVIEAFLAATTIEHDLWLVTRNPRDMQHSGATLFNPWDHDPGRRR
jgi:hypothetical protein